MIKILNLTEKYIILITLFLYPLFVLTYFTNVIETPKLLLLLTSVSLLLLVKTIKIFDKQNFEVNLTKFDLFALLFGLIYLLSGFFSGVNRFDVFFFPGTASFVVLSVIFYFLVNQTNHLERKSIILAIIASIFTMSIIQIVAFVGITKLVPFLPEILKIKNLTSLGNPLSSIIVSISILPIVIHKIMTNKEVSEKVLSTLVAVVILVSTAFSIFIILPNKNTSISILNYKIGWSVAIDSIKENPILGVGPSNFLYAFNKFRPIEFNQQKGWDLKYNQSSSQFLNSISEVGIAAIILFAYLGVLLFKKVDIKNPLYLSVSILFIGFILLPLPSLVYLFLFVLLSLTGDSKILPLGTFLHKIPQVFIALPLSIMLVFTSFVYSKAFYAEYMFSRSVSYLNKNDGLNAYNYINKAISTNRQIDRYHLVAAGINLALAENIAKKTDITDEDRSNVSKLIQQAISEGKASVATAPEKSTNWEALSEVYKTIMSFAKGSDVFAIESIKQAVFLDPINPLIRIKMGGLYYSLKEYDKAIETFKLAIVAKPDLPNAHYNLALAYKANKQLDKAKEEINTTLSLLGKESTGYEKALKELQDIEELSKPEEKIEPVIEPQLELPQETTTESQI